MQLLWQWTCSATADLQVQCLAWNKARCHLLLNFITLLIMAGPQAVYEALVAHQTVCLGAAPWLLQCCSFTLHCFLVMVKYHRCLARAIMALQCHAFAAARFLHRCKVTCWQWDMAENCLQPMLLGEWPFGHSKALDSLSSTSAALQPSPAWISPSRVPTCWAWDATMAALLCMTSRLVRYAYCRVRLWGLGEWGWGSGVLAILCC